MIANHRITLISLQHPTQYKSSIKVPSKSPSLSPGRIIVQFSGSVVPDSLRPHVLHTAGFPILQQLLELAQTHVHRVGDAIQPSHPLLSPSPPALNLSQKQSLF